MIWGITLQRHDGRKYFDIWIEGIWLIKLILRLILSLMRNNKKRWKNVSEMRTSEKHLPPPYSSRFSSVSTCKLHHAHPKNTLPLPYSSRFRCLCFLTYKLHHASIFYLNYTWGLKLTVRMIPINSRKNSTVFGYRGTPVDVKYVFFPNFKCQYLYVWGIL